jgi:hypothetical protein
MLRSLKSASRRYVPSDPVDPVKRKLNLKVLSTVFGTINILGRSSLKSYTSLAIMISRVELG